MFHILTRWEKLFIICPIFGKMCIMMNDQTTVVSIVLSCMSQNNTNFLCSLVLNMTMQAKKHIRIGVFVYLQVLEPAFRSKFVNVNRWFTTLINQPQFKKVIGNFKVCDKMAQFDGE